MKWNVNIHVLKTMHFSQYTDNEHNENVSTDWRRPQNHTQLQQDGECFAGVRGEDDYFSTTTIRIFKSKQFFYFINFFYNCNQKDNKLYYILYFRNRIWHFCVCVIGLHCTLYVMCVHIRYCITVDGIGLLKLPDPV